MLRQTAETVLRERINKKDGFFNATVKHLKVFRKYRCHPLYARILFYISHNLAGSLVSVGVRSWYSMGKGPGSNPLCVYTKEFCTGIVFLGGGAGGGRGGGGGGGDKKNLKKKFAKKFF
jgi:hypothetical protein